MGWGNLDDGPLLDAMGNRFDALVTVDKGLAKQQNINARPFGVVVLRAKTNILAELLPLVPQLRRTLEKLGPGEIHELAG